MRIPYTIHPQYRKASKKRVAQNSHRRGKRLRQRVATYEWPYGTIKDDHGNILVLTQSDVYPDKGVQRNIQKFEQEHGNQPWDEKKVGLAVVTGVSVPEDVLIQFPDYAEMVVEREKMWQRQDDKANEQYNTRQIHQQVEKETADMDLPELYDLYDQQAGMYDAIPGKKPDKLTDKLMWLEEIIKDRERRNRR